MSDQNPGVEDPNPAGAPGVGENPSPEPEKSLNSQAKDLPWVQELMQQSAELKRIKESRADAATEAERKQAEDRAEYDKALALEQEKNEQLKTQQKRLTLDAAFAHAGISDPRLVNLFVDGYDPETPVNEYVDAVKKDLANAAFFSKQRTALTPPPPPGGSPPDDFEPERDLQSWLKSKDPKKRERAVAHNREKYARQLTKG